MSRKIQGRIPNVIVGESPGDRSSRLAVFTEEYWDMMLERVTNGLATNAAFLHEESYVLAVTEGEHNSEREEDRSDYANCKCCGENCEKEAIYEQLAELADELMENNDMTNDERRFELYREANRLLLSGGRGKGNRVPLPECVVTEIRDFFSSAGRQEACWV